MSRLAIRTNAAGRIAEVLCNDRNVLGTRAQGAMLSESLTPSAHGHLLELLAHLEDHGVAGEWVLELEIDGEITPYVCAGAADQDMVLIVGDDESLEPGAARVMVDGTAEPRLLALAERIDARIGNRDHLIEDLRRQVASLQAQLLSPIRLESELLRIAAHDLRNPLLVISMNCSYLAHEHRTLTDEQRALLTDSLDTCDFMGRILDGMTSLSRLWVGRFELSRETTDMGSLVRHVTTRYATIARPREITIELADIEPIRLTVDALKIEHVLDQLLANAVKYCRPGSRATVSLTRRDDDVIMRVEDNGPGMAPELVKILFRPFGKPHPETVDARDYNAGVGLPICRRIVEAHGGRIDIDSQPGRGSRIDVLLPQR